MKIKGKVYCFFEQSGTFKNEFKKLGIEAEDFDIQNNFGETDHVTDLFEAIEDAYDCKPSLFDNITNDDLIVAFFPCIMFCGISQMNITLATFQQRNKTIKGAGSYILERLRKRDEFFEILCKMCFVCIDRDLRLIVENPWLTNTFLKGNFIAPPTIVDNDRSRRGDYFVKPTAYWFFCCEPTKGMTYQQTPKNKMKHFLVHRAQYDKSSYAPTSKVAGICSEERSMISPDYARNFICDFILGKEQKGITQLDLFKEL